jgi:hypothetical protein
MVATIRSGTSRKRNAAPIGKTALAVGSVRLVRKHAVTREHESAARVWKGKSWRGLTQRQNA